MKPPDWKALVAEGLPLELGRLGTGAALVVPYTKSQDLIVVMVPCRQATVTKLRAGLPGYLAVLNTMVAMVQGISGGME